eukprot:2097277-Pyramimonas_sp.AAC.1
MDDSVEREAKIWRRCNMSLYRALGQRSPSTITRATRPRSRCAARPLAIAEGRFSIDESLPPAVAEGRPLCDRAAQLYPRVGVCGALAWRVRVVR